MVLQLRSVRGNVGNCREISRSTKKGIGGWQFSPLTSCCRDTELEEPCWRWATWLHPKRVCAVKLMLLAQRGQANAKTARASSQRRPALRCFWIIDRDKCLPVYEVNSLWRCNWPRGSMFSARRGRGTMSLVSVSRLWFVCRGVVRRMRWR
jgi:hypothetical protein